MEKILKESWSRYWQYLNPLQQNIFQEFKNDLAVIVFGPKLWLVVSTSSSSKQIKSHWPNKINFSCSNLLQVLYLFLFLSSFAIVSHEWEFNFLLNSNVLLLVGLLACRLVGLLQFLKMEEKLPSQSNAPIRALVLFSFDNKKFTDLWEHKH